MAQCIDRAASFGQNLFVDTRGAAGGPGPFTEAVVVDRGLLQAESTPMQEPEEDREPDEAYRNDKNVLYFCLLYTSDAPDEMRTV